MVVWKMVRTEKLAIHEWDVVLMFWPYVFLPLT